MLLARYVKEGATAKHRRFLGPSIANVAISHAPFGITGGFVIEKSNDLPRVFASCIACSMLYAPPRFM